MKEGRNTFKILTRKAIGKRPLGRSKRRWEGNIIMDIKYIGVNMRKNWDLYECDTEPRGSIIHDPS